MITLLFTAWIITYACELLGEIDSPSFYEPLGKAEWKKKSSTLQPGFGYSWIYYQDSLYVFGGKSVKGAFIMGLFLIDAEEAKCVDCRSIKVLFIKKPPVRSYACLVGFGEYLVLFAGEGEEGEVADMWAFSLLKKEWREVEDGGGGPGGMKGHSCVVEEVEGISLMLVLGGNFKGKYSADIHVCKLQDGKHNLLATWSNDFTKDTSHTLANEGQSLVSFNNHITTIAGCNYQLSKCSGDIHKLELSISPNKHLYITKQPFSITPQEKSLALFNSNFLYIFSGHSKSNKLLKSASIFSCGPHPMSDSFLEQVSTCPKNCHNRGSCSNGVCNCLPPFFGSYCELKHCTSTCGEELHHGICDQSTGECMCQQTHGGPRCEFECPFGCPEGLRCVANYKCACHNCPISALHCNEHGTLIGDTCQCISGFCGKFCEDRCPTCNGHGEFNGACCECFKGYFGGSCEFMCANRCSGHGECIDGGCECELGWEGEDCSEDFTCEKCENGFCMHGECRCYAGFTGEYCEVVACPMNCTVLETRYEAFQDQWVKYKAMDEVPPGADRVLEISTTAGHCNINTQKCECFQGFSGPDCSIRNQCTNNCNGKGECIKSMCVCQAGFSGQSCEINECPNSCSGHGECVNRKCLCEAGWGSQDCSVCMCHKGTCTVEGCKCEPGYSGAHCELSGCSDCINGVCKSNQCICASGYSGPSCSECIDPSKCRLCSSDSDCNTGKCVSHKCLCGPHHTGQFCENLVCSGHGQLIHNRCICDPDFTGTSCSVSLTCPNNCSLHGICHNGQCLCDPDFQGIDCSTHTTCVDNCNNNGYCRYGQCFCYPGYQGLTCKPHSKPACDSCTGLCISGKCYTSSSPSNFLATSQCPLDCSSRGQCVTGKCYCEKDWTGEACEVQLLQDNARFCVVGGVECGGNGICSGGKCYCAAGFGGIYCEVSVECVMCVGEHQVCEDRRCRCEVGWTGSRCDVEESCAGIECGSRGVCSRGKCLCEIGYISRGIGSCEAEAGSLIKVGIGAAGFYAAVVFCIIRVCKNK